MTEILENITITATLSTTSPAHVRHMPCGAVFLSVPLHYFHQRSPAHVSAQGDLLQPATAASAVQAMTAVLWLLQPKAGLRTVVLPRPTGLGVWKIKFLGCQVWPSKQMVSIFYLFFIFLQLLRYV